MNPQDPMGGIQALRTRRIPQTAIVAVAIRRNLQTDMVAGAMNGLLQTAMWKAQTDVQPTREARRGQWRIMVSPAGVCRLVVC